MTPEQLAAANVLRQRLDDELLAATPPKGAAGQELTELLASASDTIRELRGEVERLRDALRPFVTGRMADEVAEAMELAQWDDRLRVPVQYVEHAEALTVGDLRRARAVLGAYQGSAPHDV